MPRRTRVFINGFGRIGRTLLRQLLTGPATGDIVVAGLNDIAPLETSADLLRYDSVYGPCPHPAVHSKGRIEIGGKRIPFTHGPDLRNLDLDDVDVVLECTGQARDRTFAEAGIDAGATAVLISGPSAAADMTVVPGANDHALGDAGIVPNGSCTSIAVAPLLNILDRRSSLLRAHVTTIHCCTGSQPKVDRPRPCLERSRAAAVSMVATSTGTADQVTAVFPALEGRLSVAAVRVPCLSVSAIDATMQFSKPLEGPFVDVLRDAFSGSHLVGLTDDPCVSTGLRARPSSLVVALPETLTTGPTRVRVFGGYGNERGFSARMIEMAQKMARRAA